MVNVGHVRLWWHILDSNGLRKSVKAMQLAPILNDPTMICHYSYMLTVALSPLCKTRTDHSFLFQGFLVWLVSQQSNGQSFHPSHPQTLWGGCMSQAQFKPQLHARFQPPASAQPGRQHVLGSQVPCFLSLSRCSAKLLASVWQSLSCLQPPWGANQWEGRLSLLFFFSPNKKQIILLKKHRKE